MCINAHGTVFTTGCAANTELCVPEGVVSATLWAFVAESVCVICVCVCGCYSKVRCFLSSAWESSYMFVSLGSPPKLFEILHCS